MAVTRETLRLMADLDRAVGNEIDAVTRELTTAWAHAWDGLGPMFAAGAASVLAAVEDATPGRRQILRDPAIQEALTASVRALDGLAPLTATRASGAAQKAAQVAAEAQQAIIDSQLPPQRPVNEAIGGFAARAIAAIIARTRQRITALSRPLSPDADDAMRRELIRGMQLGLNPREVARRILQAVEGAFNGGLSRALTISRTEVMDAMRSAAAEIQNANRDVVNGWTWISELDPRRTCSTCWIMHGTEHPLSEPGPQGHPSCRCSRAPTVLSWRDLGFNIDEPPSLIPDAQATFQSLSRDDQLRIMGPGRLAALDRGDVAWGDLARLRDNPGWRPSYVPTPVRDLPRTA